MSFLFKKCVCDSLRDADMVFNGANETRKYLLVGKIEKAKQALEKLERGANAIGGEVKAEYAPMILDYRRIIDKWYNRSFAFVEFMNEGGVKEVEAIVRKYNNPNFGMPRNYYEMRLRNEKKNATIKSTYRKPKDDDDYLE